MITDTFVMDLRVPLKPGERLLGREGELRTISGVGNLFSDYNSQCLVSGTHSLLEYSKTQGI
jgi:hypothetical protein